MAAALTLAPAGTAAGQPVQIRPAAIAPKAARPLPVAIGGRVLRRDAGDARVFLRQWPGTYFETAFRGRGVLFGVGQGAATLRVLVDGAPVGRLADSAPGRYRLSGLSAGPHVVRVEVVSENQRAPTGFGGFYATGAAHPLPVPQRRRQIEFIGDSHTVGYGVRSTRRRCTKAEVRATTDTSLAFGPRLARRYRADYQINAITGRGMVRNFQGGSEDTLPAVYPFVLFDKQTPYRDRSWRPQLIVIGLGTNDFSTPLRANERWPSREALHADYEATYARFVRMLRARDPAAFIILLATDGGQGELSSEVAQVARQLRAGGERRIGVVAPRGLSFTACDFHPSAADDRAIAEALAGVIEAHPAIWRR